MKFSTIVFWQIICPVTNYQWQKLPFAYLASCNWQTFCLCDQNLLWSQNFSQMWSQIQPIISIKPWSEKSWFPWNKLHNWNWNFLKLQEKIPLRVIFLSLLRRPAGQNLIRGTRKPKCNSFYSLRLFLRNWKLNDLFFGFVNQSTNSETTMLSEIIFCFSREQKRFFAVTTKLL